MWNLTVQSIHNACNGNLRLHGHRLVLGRLFWRFRRNRIEAALRILESSNPQQSVNLQVPLSFTRERLFCQSNVEVALILKPRI